MSTTSATVTSTGTATFKGYDDDGAYEDEPAGAFSKLRIEDKKQVDLLGDGDDESDAAATNCVEDDDDEFDPRGVGNVANTGAKQEDDLLALALSGPDVAPQPALPASSGSMRTLELVQHLAAQRTTALVPVQTQAPFEAYSFSPPIQTYNTQGVQAGKDSGLGAFSGFGVGAASPESKPPMPAPGRLQRKEEEDPFGDLMDTAKKSGVV
ncbi:hypothetical protein FGB62_7g07 [Gracilaria domingensis]|nr:hypothetical protein FGB62_552g01 [Gracilaria domingensis]KAI0560325.1 hypothetical protein FGB62_117g022 [Gracilaria domingensis]KAI0566671.1 hypothetical protein FGB62_7g07 [Gracilaria domingensis]